ncbi:MAG: polynucleotide adenylyltransferase PcnB, partial [Treponema sp.]|nr:polynucleotide adenylyltransferase PcnB [Treponema sp.]
LKDGITSNTFGTIEEDVFRRDFSLNALFYDPLEQVVVDYVEGMKDIREKLIKPVIPLKVIFTDDPVRMIRAVKYAAATGFSLPWLLRRRIRREAPLLASVSPSRLTEEMLKIIRSPCAAVIVESLEAYGLYGSLQAGASRLMRERPSFKARYLKTLAGLDIRNAGLTGSSPGEALAALVRDYLEETVEWDAGTVENYQAAFALARSFVLPINPPRVELDRAVRLVFAEHGHPIKRSHAAERGRAPEGETRKRRRRRRTVSGTDPRAQGPAGD